MCVFFYHPTAIIFLTQVIQLIQPRRVVILVSKKSHEYLSSHSPGPDCDSTQMLKSLQSSSWTLPPFASSLESPNTIIGESAAGMELKAIVEGHDLILSMSRDTGYLQ